MESLKEENFTPIELKFRVYTLERPKFKAIAYAGPSDILESLPIFSRCKGCGKDWTYYIYEELTPSDRKRFHLQPGEHLEIQILEHSTFD